jgi:hypothetical protein
VFRYCLAGSRFRFRIDFKAPKPHELSVREVLVHRRRARLVFGVDITIPLNFCIAIKRATSFPVPLQKELSACIQCRSWSRKATLNSFCSNARNAASAFFCKNCLSHPLPKRRNAIFRVLNNKNGTIGRYVELVAHGLTSNCKNGNVPDQNDLLSMVECGEVSGKLPGSFKQSLRDYGEEREVLQRVPLACLGLVHWRLVRRAPSTVLDLSN